MFNMKHIIITVAIVAFAALLQANAVSAGESDPRPHEPQSTGNDPLNNPPKHNDEQPDNSHKQKNPAFFDSQPSLYHHNNGKYNSIGSFSQQQLFDPCLGNYDALNGYPQPLLFDPYYGTVDFESFYGKHDSPATSESPQALYPFLGMNNYWSEYPLRPLCNNDNVAPAQERPNSKVFNLNIAFS